MKKIYGLILLVLLAMLIIWVPADASAFEYREEEPSELSATGTEKNDLYVDEDNFDDMDEEQVTEIADPLEPWNRLMFHFNDKFYFWALKPVSRGYGAVLPKKARIGIRNFFHNITMPIRFVNCLLQGKFKSSGKELARFAINTTVGVLGFGDPAKKYAKLNPSEEDFGQTLGKYGLGDGIYIVLPFIGPSSLRDSVGLAGNTFLNPVSYVGYCVNWYAATGVQSDERVNDTSLKIGEYESLKNGALEPYEAIRDAYIQHRREKVRD